MEKHNPIILNSNTWAGPSMLKKRIIQSVFLPVQIFLWKMNRGQLQKVIDFEGS